MYETAALGAVVLIVGIWMVRRSELLRRFCIPAAVVGGLAFSLILLILHVGNVAEITFDETIKEICMRAFFCSIGFLASVSMLRSGGKMLGILIVLVAVIILMQDTLGPLCASLFGMDPKFGLALGSISLFGGHGTAAAYGSVLVNDYHLEGADVVAIASATFGLAIAGIIGGPIAKRRIKSHSLTPIGDSFIVSETNRDMSAHGFLIGMILIVVCLGLGTLVNDLFFNLGISLPTYLGALIVAVIVRNAADALGYELPVKEIETTGWICLSLFLAMALMMIKLWQLADLAAVMIITLVIQGVALALFVYYVVFRATGRNYESAALTAGFMGFGMGAIPNAVANLEAITKEFGPAPMAYFLIPLVGGVFTDLINVAILTVMLNVL